MTAYLFEVYDFAHYPGAHHARMNQLSADGWEVATAAPTFTECSVLWKHPGLSSLEEYMADKKDERPLAERSAREQYLVQQQDSLSPEGRAEAQKRAVQHEKLTDEIRDAEEKAAEERREAEQNEAQVRAESQVKLAEQDQKDAEAAEGREEKESSRSRKSSK